MAPKAARGSRLKPGPQERRPLDPQPLVRGGFPGIAALETPAAVRMCLRADSQLQGAPRLWGRRTGQRMAQNSTTIKDSDTGPIRDVAELTGDGDSTGPGRLASSDSGGLLQVKTDVGSRFLDTHQTTITSQHKQTQRDSKKARVATKQLQVAISKVAKTCSEIGERIAAIECRADVLESDLGAVTKQAAMHETQLSDIQWKIEDFENRQSRNNLRLIWIQEGFAAGALQRREKQRHLAMSAAQTELASLESQIVGLARNNAPIQDTLDKMAVMKAKIIQLYLDQDIIKAQICTQECYEFSERVGKVLAYKTRQKAARSAILAIKDRLGQIVYGDTSVLQVFKEYYSVLYQQQSLLFLDDRD
ncbi:hypothetical protein NDU88_006421 [Pleurodeles waltl]|uniref:Uncharacterized protein n=1 Tax=Pleurodeles waltl TaxID=8319 RepID=A0AAV7MJT7_PLEWA|nr:hypothetical protein NDU88_006421 [Pleurodeles waltl]